MKKITLLAAMLMTTAATSYASPAVPLKNYGQVLSTVLGGEDIRIAISIKDCTDNGRAITNQPFKIGYFTPNEVIVTAHDTISSSMNHFTTNDSRWPGRPVYQYAAYQLTPDDQMHVSVQVFDAVTHASLGSKATFQCRMGLGAFIYSR